MRHLIAPLLSCALMGCAATPQTPPGTSVTAPTVSKQGLAAYDVCVGLEAGINAAAIAESNGILPVKPEYVDAAIVATEGPCQDDKLIANSADLSQVIASLTAYRAQFPTAVVLSTQADKSAKPNKVILAIQFGQIATNLVGRTTTAPNKDADTLGKDMAAGFQGAISNWTAARGS